MHALLVQWRREAGLNQVALAARLGITQSEVSKYERGERSLGDARLRAWLGALGVSLEAAAAMPRVAPGPRPTPPHCRA